MRLSICFSAVVAIALSGLLSKVSPLPVEAEDKGMLSHDCRSVCPSSWNDGFHQVEIAAGSASGGVLAAFQRLVSSIAPYDNGLETAYMAISERRRLPDEDQGFGSAPSTGLGNAPKQGLGGKPKTGMGGKPKSKTGKKPKQGMGSKPKTGLGSKPKAEMGDKPRGLIDYEKDIRIGRTGGGFVAPGIARRGGPVAGGDIIAVQDRIMEDDGRTWVKRDGVGALEPSSSTAWGPRDDTNRDTRRFFERTSKYEANQIPAFDSARANDAEVVGGLEDVRIMQDDGARWTKRDLDIQDLGERNSCSTCIARRAKPATTPRAQTDDSLQGRGPSPAGQDDTGPNWDIDWQRRSEDTKKADFDWSKGQETVSSDPDPLHREGHPDGFIMVDRSASPETLGSDVQNMKREESDIIWEFLPEDQSRVGPRDGTNTVP